MSRKKSLSGPKNPEPFWVSVNFSHRAGHSIERLPTVRREREGLPGLLAEEENEAMTPNAHCAVLAEVLTIAV
jgi:hypothetical protein